MLLNEKISATTVRNKINIIAESIKISPTQCNYQTILVDGTKVNASGAPRGIDVHLALAPTGAELIDGRKYTYRSISIK